MSASKNQSSGQAVRRQLGAVLGDLLDPRRDPDLRDRLRAADTVREARAAVEGLGLGLEDVAGAAVLRLAARMDAGSRIIDAESEKLTHCCALALLLRSGPGAELLRDAAWGGQLAVTYARFREWVAACAAAVTVGQPLGPRAGLALAAAGVVAGPVGGGAELVARLVGTHGRTMAIEPDEVPGALLLARDEGAPLDGLLRRTPCGVRWVERRARDLVEQQTPRRERAVPLDDAGRPSANIDDPFTHVATVEEARRVRDIVDELRARGPQYAAALERWASGESRATVALRHGVTAKAIRVAEARIREALAAG